MLPKPLILLAEDGEDDAEILLEAFSRAGLSAPVHVCRDGLETIGYLKGGPPFADRALHPFPDLLLLDVNLPQVSGADVLRWVRSESHCPGLAVVMFTSFDTPEGYKNLYRAGANACLQKPVDFTQLQSRLKSIYDFWSWCEFPDRQALHC